MAAPVFDPTLAATLVSLASLANQPLSDPVLPGDWSLAFQYTAPPTLGGCQYYLAVSPSAAPTKCALVVGARWDAFIPYYTPGDNHMLMLVPGDVVGTTASISADAGFVGLYGAIRTRLWQDLASLQKTIKGFASQLPLMVVGLGPGAPVAQLAALDLRPGKTTSPSPATSLESYVFSCPPFVDLASAQSFASMVPAGFRVQAAADLFAAPAAGYVQAGVAQSLGMALPTYDSPWFERDAPYYAALLSNPARAGNSAPAVAGYDPMLAFSMAQLCAVAYQMAQHPGSTVAFSYNPYALQQNLTVNGSVWASVFEGPGHLVIALRGAVTWTELITLVSDATTANPAWLDASYGQYAQGLANLYAAGRDALRAALNTCGDKPVLLTGHDCGGALANLMAVDIAQNPLQGARTVDAIYTFGATPAADQVFASSFASGPLATCNFQVVRPNDVIPTMELLAPVYPLGTAVQLPGGGFDEHNGSTVHSLYGYIDLLNPQN